MVTPLAVQKLVDKLRTQRHITIEHKTIPGANHFFVNEMAAADEGGRRLSRLPARSELPDPLSR